MTILCTIDLLTREVSLPGDQCIASYDHNVDVIRFQAEPVDGFDFDTSTIRIAAQGPNNVRHDYAVDPSTVSIEEETGYITFDWPIPAGVTEMPIGAGFKYGDRGQLIFAVCAEIISGDTVSKAWHSDDGIITVMAHLEPESGGGEDPSETATNAQKIGQLQTATAILQREISGIASGTPPTASSTSEMDPDESTVYINTTDGNWYYWNGSAWTSGGTYGGAVTDTTLSISGSAADAKAVGDALAEKADADDVGDLSQLTTTAKDNLVSAINEANGAVTGINGRLDQQQTNIDAIAKSETTVTGNYIEVTDPDADSVVKTLNTKGTTDLKLVVCKGNILCLPYFRPNNYSTKGLTFTINSDYSITVNGTATADVTYTVAYYTCGPILTRIRNGNVQYGGFLSGCTDGSDSTYYITNVNTGQKSITGPVDIFDNDSNRTWNVAIVVKSGVTLSNKTFYPMISLTGTEEYTPPTTPLTATVESTDGEYTWDGITFNDGYNLIAGNMGNEISLSTGGYLSIKSVKDDVERVEAKVDALDANWWKGKKWVAFGTSITDNWSQNSYITQGEHTGEHTGKYVSYLLDMSELSESAFVNRGIAGGSINGHILYYIRYYASAMTNADLITIEGAVNDFATSVPLGNVGDTVPYTNSLLTDSTADGTFAGACYQAFVTAQLNAPNAVVVLLTETTGKNHEGYANYYQLRKNSLGLYQSDYIDMTMKVAEFVGIPVINCGRDSMINAQNPQYIADHIHHTFLGGYQYATVIWDKLKEIPLKQMELPS